MSAEPLWRDQLEARIRTEGGRWDSQRMFEACRTAGHYVTVQRARLIFRHLADQHPGLLVKVDGMRWTYDVQRKEGDSMIERKTYTIRATPEGKFWVVHIDGLPPGMTGVTQALAEDGPDGIEVMARDCIAVLLEVDEDSFDLEITKETV